ncbi:hypothetical protein M0802_011936 [Mischocyttarus mexicanus]|nr:hypothetical protein M0802_011936 [Mischocyttarus mexicanus]
MDSGLRTCFVLVKIIDNDIDLNKLRPIEDCEFDIFINGKDAPQIAGIIDKPREGEFNIYDSNLCPPRKSRKTSDSDLSLPRKNLSPLRRNGWNNDSDMSAPRKSRETSDSYLSSHRKNRRNNGSNLSPCRNRRKDNN